MTKFHQFLIFSSNFQIFMSMGQTWSSLKLFTRNFSEADTCTIWNYNMKSQTGQKENANQPQTFEHRPKMWKKFTKKIGPNLDQTGPGHDRIVLLYKPGLKKPSLQAIFGPIILLIHHRRRVVLLSEKVETAFLHHRLYKQFSRSKVAEILPPV